MNKQWRISALVAAMVMLMSTSVMAIVEVEAFIKPIMDLGQCDPLAVDGSGDPAPILDKCGFNDYPIPVPVGQVNSYRDGVGAHEVIGTVRFTAERGQTGVFSGLGSACANGLGVSDDGDWDIPNRLFTCVDGSSHAEAVAQGLTVPDPLLLTGGCYNSPNGIDNSVDAKQVLFKPKNKMKVSMHEDPTHALL